MNLPTPEQERAAIVLMIGGAVLAALGAAAVVALTGMALGKVAQWVFG